MLCEELGGDNLKLNSKVLSLSCNVDGSSPFSICSWSLSYAANDAKKKALRNDQSFDAVIMTVRKLVASFKMFNTSNHDFLLRYRDCLQP